jgi:mgtE-like transporter
MALAPRRRARRLWGYWRSEQRTLRQGFVALMVSTAAALVAGITLGTIRDTLILLPSLYILIPAAVGMRGTIFGAIGARFGTSAAAGVFDVTWNRSGVLYQNVYTGVVTTFSSSLYLAALARFSALAFGFRSISFLDFVTISVVGGVLGSAVILLLTVGLSVTSYRRGYDLDTVSTPLVTAAGDMVTIPTLYLATFLVRIHLLDVIVALVCVAACVYATIRGAMTRLPLARRAIFEMIGVIVLTPILDILAGTVVEPRLDRFALFPALLVIIPPLVSDAGALGGIFSSRISSKLHLGVIEASGRPTGAAYLDASLVVGFGVVAFLAVGSLGYGYSLLVGESPGAMIMIGGTLLAGFLSTLISIVVSYYVAVASYRFGLDPDNQSVPIITSVMDLAGVLCFLFVLSVLGLRVPVHA